MSTLYHRPAAAARRRRAPDRAASPVARLLALLAEWRRRRRSRADLQRMSERQLRDLGLTPGDVRRESRKPFWRD